MPYVPCMPEWSTWPRGNVPTCQTHANFLFLSVNVPINVMTCKRCANVANVVKLACQRAKQCANFSFWHANVPKGLPNFQTFFLRNAKGSFYTLLLYKKFYIILDIIVMHVIYICIIHKHFIILHFYTSCHIKEKRAEFLFFETFLFSS